MTPKDWRLGDRLIHAGKPEWGVGEVRGAEQVMQNGTKCQRLTVRFERAGVKTLSTAFADLRSADAPPFPAGFAVDQGGEDGAEQAEASPLRLGDLPEAATDPFRSRRARLETTLKLYRFTGTGAGLLDWAAAQTGLKDPLSRFSRHELEQLFERFRVNLDNHLRRLAMEIRHEDPRAVAELMPSAPAAAQQALRRLDLAR